MKLKPHEIPTKVQLCASAFETAQCLLEDMQTFLLAHGMPGLTDAQGSIILRYMTDHAICFASALLVTQDRFGLPNSLYEGLGREHVEEFMASIGGVAPGDLPKTPKPGRN